MTTRLTPRQATAWFAERGITVDRATLGAWIRQGILLEGRRIFLKGRRVGRRWFVQALDLSAFLEELNFRPALTASPA